MKNKLIFILLMAGIITLIIISAILTVKIVQDDEPISEFNHKRYISQKTPVLTDSMNVTIIKDLAAKKDASKYNSIINTQNISINTAHTASIQTNAIGIVTFIKGYASGKLHLHTRKLGVNSPVFRKEIIETENNSRLKIKFNDNSIITMGANSSFIMDSFVYNPNKLDKSFFQAGIIKGTFRIISGEITSLGNYYKIKTKLATIGIRGCDLSVQSTFINDNIFILGLSKKEKVDITTHKKGLIINDIKNNLSLPVNENELNKQTIELPGTAVSVKKGIGSQQHKMDAAEMREVYSNIDLDKPAKYKLVTSPERSVFTLVNNNDVKK